MSTRELPGLGITIRTLPGEEVDRIVNANGPMHHFPNPGVLKDKAKIAVLEKDGAIIGYWVMFDTVHIEPLHLDPEVRQHPKAAMALLAQVYTELQDAGVGSVFAIISDEDAEVMAPMAEQLGLTKLPGSLYGGVVPPKG